MTVPAFQPHGPSYVRLLRRCAAAAFLAVPLGAHAQGVVTITAGGAPSALIAPGSKLGVPIVADLSASGGASLASLTALVAWSQGRLTLDSIRPGGLGALTTNVASDHASFAVFAATGVTVTTTVATYWFTAAASTGGTQVVPQPTAAGTETGTSLAALLRARAMDVCIAPIGRLGDVTGDSAVNIIDAQQIARYAVGLPVANPSALSAMGDVTADNSVDIIDAQQIARFSIGLSASASINSPTPLIAPVTSVSVSAPATSVAVGSNLQLAPALQDSVGTPLVGCSPVTWSSSAPTVATVTTSGSVQALAPGAVTITATAAGRSGSITLTSFTPVGSVALSPDTATVHMGDTVRVVPTVKDANGVTLTGQAVTYASSDPTVATVAADGLVTTYTVGPVTITATSAGRSGSTRLQVAPPTATALAVGANHTCVLIVDGSAWCWGANTSGQLGDGTLTNASSPVRVGASAGLRFIAINAGESSTCAISTARLIYCWGSVGTRGVLTTPVLVSSTLQARAISVGNGYGCALDPASAGFCWGRNPSGPLGSGDTVSTVQPVPVTGGLTFSSISASLVATCGLATDGTAYCWGSNSLSELGKASNPSFELVPTAIDGGLTFRSLAIGATLGCGVATDNNAYCWGINEFGTNGSGSTAGPTNRVPTAVTGGIQFASMSPGTGNNVFDANCGLTADGTAYCWGPNSNGQLGTSATLPGSCTQGTQTFACTGTPTPVSTSEKFVTLGPSNSHNCGLTTTRLLLCWGANSSGQVGDGSTTDRFTPVTITGLRIP